MNTQDKQVSVGRNGNKGFTILELVIVLAIAMILGVLAIPTYNTILNNLRIAGDGRNLSSTINAARMQAAANFTRSRVYADLGANTFHTELWNKTGNNGAGCWQTVGDPNNPCTVATSPVQNLSSGVTFGLGNAGSAPPNTQNPVGQAPACAAASTANTACIVFNSRGMPIDPTNGVPTANDALYVNNVNMTYGLTLSATGYSQVWAASGSGSWCQK